MPLTTAMKNVMLNAGVKGTAPALNITHASLHTADPGENGANEVAGGAPAYARKAISFADADAGASAQNGAAPAFDVPAGTTVTHVGYWSAAVGGTFLGSDPVTNEVFAAQGVYTLNSSNINLNG